jgi:hypothetical protein
MMPPFSEKTHYQAGAISPGMCAFGLESEKLEQREKTFARRVALAKRKTYSTSPAPGRQDNGESE